MEVDEDVFVCVECHTDQPEHYIERNAFAQQGSPVPCCFCGGVTVFTTRGQRADALRQSDRQRGLATGSS